MHLQGLALCVAKNRSGSTLAILCFGGVCTLLTMPDSYLRSRFGAQFWKGMTGCHDMASIQTTSRSGKVAGRCNSVKPFLRDAIRSRLSLSHGPPNGLLTSFSPTVLPAFLTFYPSFQNQRRGCYVVLHAIGKRTKSWC